MEDGFLFCYKNIWANYTWKYNSGNVQFYFIEIRANCASELKYYKICIHYCLHLSKFSGTLQLCCLDYLDVSFFCILAPDKYGLFRCFHQMDFHGYIKRGVFWLFSTIGVVSLYRNISMLLEIFQLYDTSVQYNSFGLVRKYQESNSKVHCCVSTSHNKPSLVLLFIKDDTPEAVLPVSLLASEIVMGAPRTLNWDQDHIVIYAGLGQLPNVERLGALLAKGRKLLICVEESFRCTVYGAWNPHRLFWWPLRRVYSNLFPTVRRVECEIRGRSFDDHHVGCIAGQSWSYDLILI